MRVRRRTLISSSGSPTRMFGPRRRRSWVISSSSPRRFAYTSRPLPSRTMSFCKSSGLLSRDEGAVPRPARNQQIRSWLGAVLHRTGQHRHRQQLACLLNSDTAWHPACKAQSPQACRTASESPIHCHPAQPASLGAGCWVPQRSLLVAMSSSPATGAQPPMPQIASHTPSPAHQTSFVQRKLVAVANPQPGRRCWRKDGLGVKV